eukprot:scpid88265/ scgid26750/ Inositol oxygenase; Aldehyde reductase-like 6; Myo-inositol oxygenase; Renal-specific oxidoreductase
MRVICDPSPLFRPEEVHAEQRAKQKDDFRNYEDNVQTHNVRRTYTEMHTKQTMEFGKEMRAKWCSFNHAKMSIMSIISELDNLVDESDPDIDLPNSVHAFQTAERIREAHPDKPWFHLVGLIHDIGKVMALWGEPQWCVVGDTFPVGCRFSQRCVFPETFAENPDSTHEVYSTKLGVYEQNCGLDKVTMSWGHDEYLYQCLKHSGTTIPDEGLYMIRFHSFYPWHSGDDYDYLCNDYDRDMLPWVREFNKFDLYSKSDSLPDKTALTSYYQSLVEKYIGSDDLC